jgi:16S rRNA (guanine527-N7)-methyltransferase
MTLAELREAGYDLDAESYARLCRYVGLLLQANQKVNLISRASTDQIWVAHICDSLALLPLIRERRPKSVLDLGAGGGLPGVPIACVHPELDVVLIDATRKKVAAVEAIVSGIGQVQVRCIWGRAETLARDAALHERFDAVTARAVGTVAELVSYAADFLRPGGQGWFFKTAPAAPVEVTAAAKQAHKAHLRHVENRAYRLPTTGAARAIVVYEKSSAPDGASGRAAIT